MPYHYGYQPYHYLSYGSSPYYAYRNYDYYRACDTIYAPTYADVESYRFYDVDLYDVDRLDEYAFEVPGSVLAGSTGMPVSEASPWKQEQFVPGVESVLAEGQAAFVDLRYENARRMFAKAMFLDDRDGRSKLLYAVASVAVGDIDLAGLALRRALLTTPELVENPWDLRMLYADELALNVHLSRLSRYASDHPERRDVQLLLGYLYFGWGSPERAHTHFNRLVLTDSEDLLAARLRDSAQAIMDGISRGG